MQHINVLLKRFLINIAFWLLFLCFNNIHHNILFVLIKLNIPIILTCWSLLLLFITVVDRQTNFLIIVIYSRCKKGTLSCWRIKPQTKTKLSKTSKKNKKITKKKNSKTSKKSKKSSRKTRRRQRRINNKLGIKYRS